MKNKKKDNLWLWSAVETTDPNYTRKVGFGRKFTTVNAQHQMHIATEQFGPIGSGWGVKDERFNLICDGLIGYQAVLWYRIDDTICEYDINSSINTHTGKGKLDDECYKKVSTDALTKGLSKLGFNADIFLGKYDDNRYVSELEEMYKPSLYTGEPKNTFKKKMTKQILVAMLDYVADGKSEQVLAKLSDYEVSADQHDILDKAIKEYGNKNQ